MGSQGTRAIDRRDFLGTAAMTVAAAQLGALGSAAAQTSVGTLKQIDAGVLSIGYSHRVLTDIGHNVPQEAPREFAKAIVDVDGY
jgi:hypothetical protein